MSKEPARTVTVYEHGFLTTFRWSGGKIESVDIKRTSAERGKKTEGTEKERRWLRAFFAGRNVKGIPLDTGALTFFQKRVYKVVSAIPPGRTLTYGEVAKRIGRPRAARAVGQAMRANPHAPFMPCHRVVAADGLGGYSGKMHSKTKTALLEWERGRREKS
ncbi:MAG: MGMT family protein [Acidobacteriota bacterium]|nr:MAG: MGMT family protein [Acidobacteriota bacterium]